jgi:hypothetical protein
VDETQTRMDEVSRGDGMRTCVEEDVLEVSTNACNLEQ